MSAKRVSDPTNTDDCTVMTVKLGLSGDATKIVMAISWDYSAS